MMKSKLVLMTAIAFVFGASGTASAGMAGQGTHPDTKMSEKAEAAKKGMSSKAESKMGNKGSAAVEETATTPATKKNAGGEKGTDKMK